jgi:hypothetical protein
LGPIGWVGYVELHFVAERRFSRIKVS